MLPWESHNFLMRESCKDYLGWLKRNRDLWTSQGRVPPLISGVQDSSFHSLPKT
jgi:hypothetical protein